MMREDLDLGLVAISSDDPARRERLVADLEAFAAGGVTAFMFREKSLSDEDFVALGRDLRARCDRLGLRFILNERVHLTEPIGARVVHLTWRSPDLATARREVAPEVLFGRSVHAEEEAVAAAAAGIDYLVFGPVFDTPSKAGLVATRGIPEFASLAKRLDLPIVAVGGIVAERAAELRRAGAAGIAVIRALMTDDPEGAARALRSAWEERA